MYLLYLFGCYELMFIYTCFHSHISIYSTLILFYDSNDSKYVSHSIDSLFNLPTQSKDW